MFILGDIFFKVELPFNMGHFGVASSPITVRHTLAWVSNKGKS